jgi:hypothetical protein
MPGLGQPPMSQEVIEQSWLDLTYRAAREADGVCICRPSAFGARWSGYLGPAYATTRVLLVGANHNGGKTGLQKTPQMARYNTHPRTWAAAPRDPSGRRDRDLLAAMRETYTTSWRQWGAVWAIFGAIRREIRVADDAFAFVNLARCPEPDAANDDRAIVACQWEFPLAEFVERCDARVIFVAKSGAVGGGVRIPGEGEERLVVRYANGSYGQRPGAPHYTDWLPAVGERVRAFLRARSAGMTALG